MPRASAAKQSPQAAAGREARGRELPAVDTARLAAVAKAMFDPYVMPRNAARQDAAPDEGCARHEKFLKAVAECVSLPPSAADMRAKSPPTLVPVVGAAGALELRPRYMAARNVSRRQASPSSASTSYHSVKSRQQPASFNHSELRATIDRIAHHVQTTSQQKQPSSSKTPADPHSKRNSADSSRPRSAEKNTLRKSASLANVTASLFTSEGATDEGLSLFFTPPEMRSRETKEKIAAAMRSMPALSNCSMAVLSELSAVCRLETHYGIVFRQGDEAISWYIILRGAVDIFIVRGAAPSSTTAAQLKSGPSSPSNSTIATGSSPPSRRSSLSTSERIAQDNLGTKIASLAYGKAFGELALISNNPRSATITCCGDFVHLLAIDRDDYQRTLRNVHQHEISQKCLALHAARQFQTLSPEELLMCASVLKFRSVAPGTELATEGKLATSLYIVRKGIIELYRRLQIDGPGGKRVASVKIGHKTTGDYFGEEWVLFSSKEELVAKYPQMEEHEAFTSGEKMPCLMTAKASRAGSESVDLAEISIIDAQTRMSKFLTFSDEQFWDRAEVKQLWDTERLQNNWQKIRRTVLRQMRLQPKRPH